MLTLAHTFIPQFFQTGGGDQRLTTENLMSAYASGKVISIYSIASSSWITGHIQGITNESGTRPGQTPTMLIVTLSRRDEHNASIYVRTTG